MCSKFLLRQLRIFLGSISQAFADSRKKERKTKIQTFEYLENEKSFLDKIKAFKGLSFAEK